MQASLPAESTFPLFVYIFLSATVGIGDRLDIGTFREKYENNSNIK